MRFNIEDVSQEFFWAHVERGDGCWRWTGFVDAKGYGRIQVKRADRVGRASEGAYRVSWALKNGPIPNGLHILHSCDNPICVNPDHLRVGTHAENMMDIVRAGRAGRKLTPDSIRKIRAAYRSGAGTQRTIAAQFGVSQTLVGRIADGRLWGHVQ